MNKIAYLEGYLEKMGAPAPGTEVGKPIPKGLSNTQLSAAKDEIANPGFLKNVSKSMPKRKPIKAKAKAKRKIIPGEYVAQSSVGTPLNNQ